MPAQALYLKYRPRSLDDVQGQDHITHTLKNALALNRIAHAYLFTGTRGTGKTSTARILAKAVNCLDTDVTKRPCNNCAICRAINEERLLDLVEIDAASNTGVDNIRDLREKVDFRPSEARFKVYIIDEAHMLSNAAFNALLKTLEEPPAHVIFILATTEVNRVPATITSRCQRFDFKRASLQELQDQLGGIAKQEGMELEPAALELVARQANGSFRDGESLLDQLTAYSGDVITLRHVQVLLGAASREHIRDIVTAIAARDVGRGIAALDAAVDAGADPRQVARDVVEYLRGVLMFTVSSESTLTLGDEVRAEMKGIAAQTDVEQVSRAIRLFSQAIQDLRHSASPTLPLEMALVEASLQVSVPAVSAAPPAARRAAPPAAPPPAASANPFVPSQPTPKASDEPTFAPLPQVKKKESAEPPAAPPTPAAPGELSLEAIRRDWETLIARIHKLNRNTDALLKDAYPLAVKDKTVTLAFFYPAHKDRAEKDTHLAAITKAFSDQYGTRITIKCEISPEQQEMQNVKNDPLVRQGMNIGGKVTKVTKRESE